MAATLKAAKQLRIWNNDDSFEKSDVVRLFDPEKTKYTKPSSCVKYWTVYLSLLGFLALFVVGILLGYFLRADPKVGSACSEKILRSDGFSKEKLQAVHNNIMYFMSSKEIAKHKRNLKTLQVEGSKSTGTGNYVENIFRQLELDDVHIEESHYVVTYPDSKNRLEILSFDGRLQDNVTINRNTKDEKGDNADGKPPQFGEYLIEGSAKGPVVYGHYGRKVDFLHLDTANVTLEGSILLLQMGRSTVSNQVALATEVGCAGVILFCCHDNCYHGYRFENRLQEDLAKQIPLLTISCDVAVDLQRHMTGISAVEKQWMTDVLEHRNNEMGTARTLVNMEVHGTRVTHTLVNVIGTIYGADEPEHEVLIGARHGQSDKFSVNYHTAMSSGILLELARSMAYVKHTQAWKPRRTVKFVSWGGNQRSNIGMMKYIQKNSHILGQEAVTYIDLDLLDTGSDVMQFESSPGLVNLIRKAADMVPDPSNPEISLAESWHVLNVTNQSAVDIYKVGEAPALSHLGISSLTLRSLQVEGHKVVDERDTIHYYQYPLAAARVMSLISVMLLDNVVIPINVSYFTEYVSSVVKPSLKHVEETIPSEMVKYKTGAISSSLDELVLVAGRILPALTGCSDTHQLNSILGRLEAAFITQGMIWAGNQPVTDTQTGIVLSLSEALEMYSLNFNVDTVYTELDTLLDHIHEAINMLKSVLR